MLPGLAPLACDSGDKKGQRHIRGGRAHVRTTLSMAAAAASRTNPDLAGYYKRLSEKGKAAKIAIVAVIRKRVVLANTLNMLDPPLKRTYSPETIARRKAILARNRAALAAIRKSLKPKPPAKVWRPRLADVENLLGMSSGFRGMTHRKSPCRQAFQPRFFRLWFTRMCLALQSRPFASVGSFVTTLISKFPFACGLPQTRRSAGLLTWC
jgi:hypothetical protein